MIRKIRLLYKILSVFYVFISNIKQLLHARYVIFKDAKPS